MECLPKSWQYHGKILARHVRNLPWIMARAPWLRTLCEHSLVLFHIVVGLFHLRISGNEKILLVFIVPYETFVFINFLDRFFPMGNVLLQIIIRILLSYQSVHSVIFRPHIMGEENHNLCCVFSTNSAKRPLYYSI